MDLNLDSAVEFYIIEINGRSSYVREKRITHLTKDVNFFTEKEKETTLILSQNVIFPKCFLEYLIWTRFWEQHFQGVQMWMRFLKPNNPRNQQLLSSFLKFVYVLLKRQICLSGLYHIYILYVQLAKNSEAPSIVSNVHVSTFMEYCIKSI